jgi:coiled-coil domain-containing protein 130
LSDEYLLKVSPGSASLPTSVLLKFARMQGFNMGRYHPPSSLDTNLSTGKPSGGFNRTPNGRSTQASGPPTIRFEMPFAIWCTTCSPELIIGQGVRFNAQKLRVGNYHSTPIWSFTMKHTVCGGLIEIRTDPAAGDYVVEKGARKRDYGEEKFAESRDGMFGETITAEERERRLADPFANLEGKVDQGDKVRSQNWWVEKLRADRDQYWDDPWTANRRLRKSFRTERKELQEKDRDREEIADRLGLGIAILDEIGEDGQRAALVSFGESEATTERNVTITAARPLFDESSISKTIDSSGTANKTKAEIKAEKSKLQLQHHLKGNTRAVVDPFLGTKAASNPSSSITTVLAGIKRKRLAQEVLASPASKEVDPVSLVAVDPEPPTNAPLSGPLVAYGSDED